MLRTFGRLEGELEEAMLQVLACSVPEAERRLREIFEGDRLLMAYSMEEALRALVHGDFDLVIIGMLFDESRALELMRTLKSNDTLSHLPIAGIRGAKHAHPIPPDLFDVPMKALGAFDVVDVGSIPDNAAGNRRIRDLLTDRPGRAG